MGVVVKYTQILNIMKHYIVLAILQGGIYKENSTIFFSHEYLEEIIVWIFSPPRGNKTLNIFSIHVKVLMQAADCRKRWCEKEQRAAVAGAAPL